jgi:hypothetical protein
MQAVLAGAHELPPHLLPRSNGELPTVPQGKLAAAQVQAAVAALPAAHPQAPQQQPHVAPSPAAAPAAPMPAQAPYAAVASPRPPAVTPEAPARPAGAPRTNVGLLIGVAVVFMLMGIGITIAIMKFL